MQTAFHKKKDCNITIFHNRFSSLHLQTAFHKKKDCNILGDRVDRNVRTLADGVPQKEGLQPVWSILYNPYSICKLADGVPQKEGLQPFTCIETMISIWGLADGVPQKEGLQLVKRVENLYFMRTCSQRSTKRRAPL